MKSALLEIQKMELKLFKKGQPNYEYRKWFIKNAVLFRDSNEELSAKIAKIHHLKIQQCYFNSWMGLTYHPRTKYYEGYVWSETCPIPIQHAWLVVNDKGGGSNSDYQNSKRL